MKKLIALAVLIIPAILAADVDTKDGAALSTTSDVDGFSSNIDDCDGQVVATGGVDTPCTSYVTDSFGDTGAPPPNGWTEESGSWSEGSGVMAVDQTSTSSFLRNNTTNDVDGFGCWTITNEGSSNEFSGVAFRWVDEGKRYYLIHDYWNANLIWAYATDDAETGYTAIATSSGSITSAEGDKICFTIDGEDSAIALKVWQNPTNSCPNDKDNWDSASDAADWSPSAPGASYYIDSTDCTTACNQGLYIYDDGTADVQIDDYSQGDL